MKKSIFEEELYKKRQWVNGEFIPMGWHMYEKQDILNIKNEAKKKILDDIIKIKTATYNWKFLDRAKKIIEENL